MKNNRNNVAVTEVLGTLLMLGMATTLFAVIATSVFSLPEPSFAPSVNIVGTVEGSNFILEHRGGDLLGLDTNISLDICGQSTSMEVGEYLDDKCKEDDSWNLGERMIYPFEYRADDPYAKVKVIDIKTNSIIMDADLALPQVCDIALQMDIDDQSPNINQPVTITITALNNGGNVNATNVRVRIFLPVESEYLSHIASRGSYCSNTGIWDINNLEIGESSTLEINANITQYGSSTGFTQLAILLDGSGSIKAANWSLMLNGLAAAVEDGNCLPHDRSVELTVIQFADCNATLEVGPFIIGPVNNALVAQKIRDIEQRYSLTPTAAGINLAADILSGDPNGNLIGTEWEGKSSSNFDNNNRQVINMITDGVPSICAKPGKYSEEWPFCSGASLDDLEACAKQSAEDALSYLIETLEMNEEDEFNVQAIGDVVDAYWLIDKIVYPQPGIFTPPFIPGWVCNITTFEDLCNTIDEEFKLLFYSITSKAEVISTEFIDPNPNNNKVSIPIAPHD